MDKSSTHIEGAQGDTDSKYRLKLRKYKAQINDLTQKLLDTEQELSKWKSKDRDEVTYSAKLRADLLK